MVEKVEAYKTLDGTIFENEDEAKLHESEKQMLADVYNWVELQMDIPTEYSKEITSTIVNGRKWLQEIFNK